MKATLKFDLDNPDDVISHQRCVKALDMACVLFEVTANLKSKLEHRFEAQPQDRNEFDGLDEVFSEIGKLLDEHNLNIDELIQ